MRYCLHLLRGFAGIPASAVQQAMSTINPLIMASIVNTINPNLKDADLAREFTNITLADGVAVQWDTVSASLHNGRLQVTAEVTAASVQGIPLGPHGTRVCISANGRWRLGAQAASRPVEALANQIIRKEVEQLDLKELFVDIENGGIEVAAQVGYGTLRAQPQLGITLRVSNGQPDVKLVCSELPHKGLDLSDKLFSNIMSVALHSYVPQVLRAITKDVIPAVQQVVQWLSLPKGLGSLDPSTLQLQLSKAVVVVEGGGMLNATQLVQRLSEKVQAWKP